MILLLLFLYFSIINSDKIKGVNLGSLFVLEPYINPSLFYQFLGLNDRVVGDTYNFCDYLGPKEANRQLRIHWEIWVNEEKLNKIKKLGINTVRIPVGDWMFIPYEVYNKEENGIKCFDGSLEYLDRIMNHISSLNMNVIIDLHGVKDSQNGYDNSGLAKNLVLKKKDNILYFSHWNTRKADWIGDFNITTKTYNNINYDNIYFTLNVLKNIIERYKNFKSFWGLEPINEPWEYTPLDILKSFYRDVYEIFINKVDNSKVLIFHDSFRPSNWTNYYFLEKFQKPKVKIYLDTHQYMAWGSPISFDKYLDGANKWKQPYTIFDIIVGEFSLATDNCAMWLNGFMDNYPGFPKQDCYYDDCPYKDMFLDKIKNSINGPFGKGSSYPTLDGKCPNTIPIYLNKNISLDDDIIKNSENYNVNDKEKFYATTLFQKLTESYEKNSAGWIFWNFDTESSSYQWSYIKINDKGYMNYYEKNNLKLILVLISTVILLILLAIIIIIFFKKNNKNLGYSIVTENENYGSIETIRV